MYLMCIWDNQHNDSQHFIHFLFCFIICMLKPENQEKITLLDYTQT